MSRWVIFHQQASISFLHLFLSSASSFWAISGIWPPLTTFEKRECVHLGLCKKVVIEKAFAKGHLCKKIPCILTTFEKMSSLPHPAVQQMQMPARAVATLEPPSQYWPRFQQQWLEQVGQATFTLKKECLFMRRQRDTGHWYVSLNLGKGNHNFPVYDLHISIGVYSFESYTNMWMAWIEMSSLLFSRQVVGHFGRYGTGMNFLVLPGCELFALILLLKEKATRHSIQARDVRGPHITWHLLS